MPFPPFVKPGTKLTVTFVSGVERSLTVLDVYPNGMISYVGADGPVVISDTDITSMKVHVGPGEDGLMNELRVLYGDPTAPVPSGVIRMKPRPRGGRLVAVSARKEVRRNGECPCGSGKKSKKCCRFVQ